MKRQHTQTDLLAQAIGRVRAKHGLQNADETDLVCPNCGYQGREDSFDEVEAPDSDGDNDGDTDTFRTDPITSGTGNADDQNVGDGARPATHDSWRSNRLNALARSMVEATKKTQR